MFLLIVLHCVVCLFFCNRIDCWYEKYMFRSRVDSKIFRVLFIFVPQLYIMLITSVLFATLFAKCPKIVWYF